MIGEMLDRTQGRAFVLFTSYAAMRDVHERLAPRLRWPLLVQGTAPRTALLRDFRATPNAVLLATSSFWQGVDVAGEALSCVIIDRLPFASPADPLVAARIAAIEQRGGQPFHEYQVPLATLTLLQGLGRLIRTRPTAACSPCSIRASRGWATAAGSWPRCRRRRSRQLGHGKILRARVTVGQSFPWLARPTNPSSVTTSTFRNSQEGLHPPAV